MVTAEQVTLIIHSSVLISQNFVYSMPINEIWPASIRERVNKVMVGTAVRDKLLMGALFCNTSIFKENLSASQLLRDDARFQAQFFLYRAGQGLLESLVSAFPPPAASSRTTRGASFKIARAIEMRCLASR